MHSSISFARADRDDPEVRALFSAYVREIDVVLGPAVVEESIAVGPPSDLTPPNGTMVLARRDGEPVAIGGVRYLDTDVAEIKSMFVVAAERGSGLGPRLLAALETTAAEHGCTSVRLDTSDHLKAAIALYRRSGYVEIPAYNDNPHADLWFERRL